MRACATSSTFRAWMEPLARPGPMLRLRHCKYRQIHRLPAVLMFGIAIDDAKKRRKRIARAGIAACRQQQTRPVNNLAHNVFNSYTAALTRARTRLRARRALQQFLPLRYEELHVNNTDRSGRATVRPFWEVHASGRAVTRVAVRGLWAYAACGEA